jgi:perosamine synthetase
VIPLFKPSCGDEEIEAVSRVLRSGWWGMGPETELFEQEFAGYTGSRHAVAVSSGTAALELAARAIGLTDGVVAVPALTFVSTAQAMRHAGNQVIFADIEEDTLCIDWDDAVRKLCKPEYLRRSAGIVPVHYAGRLARMPDSIGYCRDSRLIVIEDCAHAAGTARAGTSGDAGAWSFHAVKNLATGDGGMVTTDDEDVARELRRLRWCGIDRSTWDRDKDSKVGYGWDYCINSDGEKAHMNDITAALGRVQLRHLDTRNQVRCSIASMYNEAFAGLDWLKTPRVGVFQSMHLYAARVPAADRQRFIQHMISQGVSAGVHYKPLNHYPLLFPGAHGSDTPVTERVWQTLVTLPLFPDMTHPQVEQVIAAVRSFPA